MSPFTLLYQQLDESDDSNRSQDALSSFFFNASDTDKLWVLAMLTQWQPKRIITTVELRAWAAEVTGISPELFEDSLQAVGDVLEAISLIVHNPSAEVSNDWSLTKLMALIQTIRQQNNAERKTRVQSLWRELDSGLCLVLNKLLTGRSVIDVDQHCLTQALSNATQVPTHQLAHRLFSNWNPLTCSFQELIFQSEPEDHAAQPYPFCLPSQEELAISDLGELDDWQVEWKWGGLRAQLIVRNEHLYVWTSEKELATHEYPEYTDFIKYLPNGTVLDGMILPFQHGQAMDFRALVKRRGCKRVSKKLMQQIPVAFMAFDVIEHQRQDIRSLPLTTRRAILEGMLQRTGSPNLIVSPTIKLQVWDEFESLQDQARRKRCTGYILKRKTSTYSEGAMISDWHIRQIAPLTIKAVLTYSTTNSRGKAQLYKDHTFALWREKELITFTKARADLGNQENVAIDHFIRQAIIERFGPVKRIRPELVFEIAFDDIASSTRHKAGVSVHNPRVLRWLRDESPSGANTLADLSAFILS